MAQSTAVATRRRARPAPPGRGRAVIAGLGELLVVLGAVLLLYAAWTLFGSGRATAQTQQSLRQVFAQQPPAASRPGVPAKRARVPDPTARTLIGKVMGTIRIPRLGRGWDWVILQGVGADEINNGIGHYPTTAAPGGVGNFALAGHRATHGQPFADLPAVRRGDPVIVYTRTTVYTYAVDSWEYTTPDAVQVLLPVPRSPGVRPTRRLITLTTCTPRWGHSGRFIVYGHLTSQRPRVAGES